MIKLCPKLIFVLFVKNTKLLSYQQSKGKRNPYSLSIDKIDPNKGYEVGNVQFVCFAANMMKGELSLSELKKFCQAIIKNNNYA